MRINADIGRHSIRNPFRHEDVSNGVHVDARHTAHARCCNWSEHHNLQRRECAVVQANARNCGLPAARQCGSDNSKQRPRFDFISELSRSQRAQYGFHRNCGVLNRANRNGVAL